MKFLILTLAIILSSCVTKSKFDNHMRFIAKEIDTLKHQLRAQSFFSTTSNCFVSLNTCLHTIIDPKKREECTKEHEKCVIDAYDRYKDLWEK